MGRSTSERNRKQPGEEKKRESGRAGRQRGGRRT